MVSLLFSELASMYTVKHCPQRDHLSAADVVPVVVQARVSFRLALADMHNAQVATKCYTMFACRVPHMLHAVQASKCCC